MDENDRLLLDKHALQFSRDLDLTEVIPVLMSSGLWREVHQQDLNVTDKYR
jgi:hypothetical protein